MRKDAADKVKNRSVKYDENKYIKIDLSIKITDFG